MRDTLVPVVVALLCIVAVALGAAALTSDLGGGGNSGATIVDSNTNGSNSPDSSGGRNSATGGSRQPQERGDDECVAGYDQVELFNIVFAVVVAISILVYVYSRELMLGVITFPILMLPALFGLIAMAALLGCPVPGQEAATTAVQGNGTLNPAGEVLNGGGEDSLSSRLQLLGGFLGLSLVLLLMGFYVMRRNAKGEPDEQAIEDSEIAAAAEEAAQEIEQASTDKNPIYTAWATMTEPLDVEHPETSTPQEFADAALEAGLNADDVRELTDLFETVRYGTTPVTSQHEKRAMEALRRIEQDYSEGMGNDGAVSEDDSDNQDTGPDSGDSDRRER
jgi:hypothetical protein